MPLKRNKNLVSLSREHHFGLLFCWKIRQGLIKKVDLERIRAFVDYFWNSMLNEHFEKEEKTLFEIEGNDLIAVAEAQHVAIRNLAESIINTDNDSPLPYSQLADLVAEHIRFEERDLFPDFEKTLNGDELDLIGAHLGEELTMEEKYHDEFWI